MTIHTVSGEPREVTIIHPTDADPATWLMVTYEGHKLQLRFPDTAGARRMLTSALRCLEPVNAGVVASGEVLTPTPPDDGTTLEHFHEGSMKYLPDTNEWVKGG